MVISRLLSGPCLYRQYLWFIMVPERGAFCATQMPCATKFVLICAIFSQLLSLKKAAQTVS